MSVRLWGQLVFSWGGFTAQSAQDTGCFKKNKNKTKPLLYAKMRESLNVTALFLRAEMGRYRCFKIKCHTKKAKLCGVSLN